MARKQRTAQVTTIELDKHEAEFMGRLKLNWKHSDAKPKRARLTQNQIVAAGLLLLEGAEPHLRFDEFDTWDDVLKFLQDVRIAPVRRPHGRTRGGGA